MSWLFSKTRRRVPLSRVLKALDALRCAVGSLPRCLRIASRLIAALGVLAWPEVHAEIGASDTIGKPAAAAASASPASSASSGPHPILWGKRMFFIPYQANPLDASRIAKVALWMSRNGSPFAPLEEARPAVTGFAYHAPEDGDYQFSLQLSDSAGRVWPPMPLKPLLEIQVDTAGPTLNLTAETDREGQIVVEYEANDRHLDVSSLRLDRQDADGTWNSLTRDVAEQQAEDRVAGRVTALSPMRGRAPAFRLAALDRAGNESVKIAAAAALDRPPSPRRDDASSTSASPSDVPNLSLEWPANNVLAPSRSPEPRGQPSSSGPSFEFDDAPSNLFAPSNFETQTAAQTADAPIASAARTQGRFVSGGGGRLFGEPPVATGNDPGSAPSAHGASGPSTVAPSSTLRPTPSAGAASPPTAPALLSGSRPRQMLAASGAGGRADYGPREDSSRSEAGVDLPAGSGVRVVNSRTFDIEYELEQVGPWGLAKVELWGTRDGGRSWESFGMDPDNRSPARVTVAAPGDYGFLIVVDAAGQMASPPPHPGTRPELFVHVDLQPPSAKLVGISTAGSQQDRLLIGWEASDVNLEPRPIGLFYSSYAAGPWATIATGLENTGSYEWQFQRHLPERFYLRLEVRDTAGNVASDQLRDPVTLDRPQPAGRLRDVRAVTP